MTGEKMRAPCLPSRHRADFAQRSGGKNLSITRRVAVGGLAALPFVQTKAQAQQNFPSKPFTLVVPFPAGGPADIFGRNLAGHRSAGR